MSSEKFRWHLILSDEVAFMLCVVITGETGRESVYIFNKPSPATCVCCCSIVFFHSLYLG